MNKFVDSVDFMLLISLSFCVLSYVNRDPIKSSFFLVFSMLFCIPVMSFVSYVGIFVILVYFSIDMDYSKWLYVGLAVFYYELNVFILMYLILLLVFFMRFVSYYLSFSGALRRL
ncbi:unnamed protein product [Angiostrongylus costaricensis]|uniref:NADH dehydrogenase subunit 6 n=1 Tax=Angiostrongylus costaricensis TaxID=334426 RepID=A0A0R3PQF3_ANGCS|nr:unnamed protein product [Angiostrongylus costaricensis]